MWAEFANWLQTTAGILTAAGVVAGAIAAIVRFAWGAYRKLNSLMAKVDVVYAEVTPNGGGSIKDAIVRMEAMQLAALQLTGKAYWLSAPDGRCTFASNKLAMMMGLTPDQIQGWGWVSAVAPEYRRPCKEEWMAAVSDQREFHMDYEYVRPDGSRLPVTGHAIPCIHAQTKQTVGMIGYAVCRDMENL